MKRLATLTALAFALPLSTAFVGAESLAASQVVLTENAGKGVIALAPSIELLAQRAVVRTKRCCHYNRITRRFVCRRIPIWGHCPRY